MTRFTVIAIIFNPNSTGSSDDLAERLAQDLKEAGVDTPVELTPTQYAGHAVELAYDLARQHERPLIISSSGDGGYNEVINGALRARGEGANPVCAVLAAGNANDHSRTVMNRPLSEAIDSGDVVTIDVLKAAVVSGADEVVHYAHSYIGLGLTPTVAVDLNRTKLNRFKETFIVYKALKDLHPVEIEVQGKRKKIDSLVIANISQMAKFLTIAENAEPDDGRMKITVFPYRKKARLIFMLVKAMVKGIRGRDARRYEFRAVKDMVMQIDGEVKELSAGDTVTVTVMAGALDTLR